MSYKPAKYEFRVEDFFPRDLFYQITEARVEHRDAILEHAIKRKKRQKLTKDGKLIILVGPIIDKKSVDKFLLHVDDAVNKGGKLLYGGKRITRGEFAKGNFIEPTVISDVKDNMLCMCDETFGPLAPISTFENFDEVIERANATPFGLSAYLYTQNLGIAFKAGEALEAGTIGINDDVPSTTIAPFGGVKQSGLGRECGQEGLEAFLETKHLSIVI